MRGTLRGITRRAAPILAAGLVLAACGTDDSGVADAPDETGDAEVTEDADDTVSTEDEAAGPVDVTVQVAGTDLGEVLVDGDGQTLYLFESDEQGASTCYEGCADSWPPLLDDDPVAGDGADEALLGTTERDDGRTQVTYDGWPLYHWVGDQQPGDVEGQGVQDVWWVLAANGDPVRDAAATDEADDEEAPAY